MTGVNTTISRDGTRLAYEVNGEGPLLVYVTGAICHRTFRPVQKGASVLSRSFRVLSYDRRGRGDSTDTAPWSLDREVEDLEALIEERIDHARSAQGSRTTARSHTATTSSWRSFANAISAAAYTPPIRMNIMMRAMFNGMLYMSSKRVVAGRESPPGQ